MNELLGKRVLIVEDDITNMAIFAVTLKRAGAIVIQDPWTTNALMMLQKFAPVDVIIMDLMLRYQGSAYNVLDSIRSNPAFDCIPVLLVTAADPMMELPRAREKGFNGFVGKPINPEKFPLQVASCIRREPVWFAPNGQDY